MDPTPANLQIFFTGIRNMYNPAYAGTEVWYPKIATDMTSDTSLETYGWMDRLPTMRQWIGPRNNFVPIAQSRIVQNLDWELTVSIDRNTFLDDKFGLYSPISTDMGRQVKKQDDYQLAALLETNPTGFDGVGFFNTAHPTDTSGFITSSTQSNDLQTLALNASNFATARAAMRNFQGRDGKPFGIMPILMVIPPSLEEAALQLQKAQFISPQTFALQPGQTMVGPTSNVWQNSFEILVIPELTKAKVWYLFDTRMAVKPTIRQVRQAPNWQQLISPTDPNVFWHKIFTWGVDTRVNYDVTLWFLALRCGNSL